MEAPATTALAAIERSALATAMRQDLWLYPAVEVLHILGFVVLVGSIAMLDLRLLGLTPQLSVKQLARHLLPWTLGSLLVIVPTGLLMFAAHAADLVGNPAFVAKLALIMAGGTNAAMFHAGTFSGAAQWDHDVATPPAAKLHAAVSLIIWVSVIGCGRLLAYL